MAEPDDRHPKPNKEEEMLLNPCRNVRRASAPSGYSQYCHWPLRITYAARIPLVTACARMQSAKLLVRIIHQLYIAPAIRPTSQ
jgi:hypothetical protein